MVVQGANDPRVKQRESDQIVVALRDRKYPVEYLLAPDEATALHVREQYAMIASARVPCKHLGGRFQKR